MCADEPWGVTAGSHPLRPGSWRLGWNKSDGQAVDDPLSGGETILVRGRGDVGLATLAELTDEAYQHLDDIARGLHERLLPHIEEHSLSMSRVGTMLTVFFRSEAPKNFEQVKECDLAAFGRFHRACLDAGVYLPCSQFEAVFLPLGLGQSDLDEIAGAMGAAMGVARA